MNETKEDAFTEIVEGVETPCQFSGRGEVCPDDPAEWIMWLHPCCEAAMAAKFALACKVCMAARLYGPDFVLQCAHCGHISDPASTAYTYIEPLEKK